jgi:hypothetical protein
MTQRLDVDQVLRGLAAEQLAIVVSVAADGAPNAAAVSWLRTAPGRSLDLMVGCRSRLLANVRVRPAVALVTFCPPDVQVLHGTARRVEGPLEGLPVPLCRVRIEVAAAFSGLFTGGELVSPPRFAKRYPERLRHLDDLVARALTPSADDVGSAAGVMRVDGTDARSGH